MNPQPSNKYIPIPGMTIRFQAPVRFQTAVRRRNLTGYGLSALETRQKRGSLFLCWIWAVFLGLIAPISSRAGKNDVESRLRADIEYLCKPELEGRDVPGLGGDLTALWLANQMLDLGLRPGVGDSSFLQSFPLVTARLDTTQSILSISIAGRESVLNWGDGFYYFPQGTIPLNKVYKAVDCGYGLDDDQLNRHDFSRAEPGAIGVVLSGSDIPLIGASARAALIPFKAAAAKRAGLNALIILFDRDKNDGLPTEIIEKYENVTKFQISLPQSSPDFPIFYLDTQHSTAKFLKENLSPSRSSVENDSFSIIEEIKVHPQIVSAGASETSGFNVLGYFPGESAEIVILCAHYDHEGAAGQAKDGRPLYYPGADDNASGVAALLELCRRWSKQPRPNRGLLVLGVAAEEDGLLGSKFFVQSHPELKKQIVAAVNLDMIGRAGFANMRDARDSTRKPDPDYIAVYYSGAAPKLRDLIRGAQDRSDLNVNATPVNGFRFSDAGSFHAAGLPAVHIFGGFHPDYIKLTDTPDKIDYAKLARTVDLVEQLLQNLIQEPQTIEFDPTLKVEGSKMPY
ncbi:MAG: M20/M25/M40 family metallo-hydrolase [Calditrichota bacterium]